MTCPNCAGRGDIVGDGYCLRCHVCGGCGLVSKQRWEAWRERMAGMVVKDVGRVTVIMGAAMDASRICLSDSRGRGPSVREDW